MSAAGSTSTNLRLCAECGDELRGTSAGLRYDEGGQLLYFHKPTCPLPKPPAPPADPEPPADPVPVPPADPVPVPPADPVPVPVPGTRERAATMLEGLDEEQLRAVRAPLGPVRILAGAGTGKTRSITHRIAFYHHLGTAPAHQVLAVTHSKRAAAEMQERLRSLGAGATTTSTFHAAARRQLVDHWSATVISDSGVG